MSTFKGEPFVFQGVASERSETGAWSSTWLYEGVDSVMPAVAAGFGRGPRLEYQNNGGTTRISAVYGSVSGPGSQESTSKWEIDREILEKDILYSKTARLLSDDAKEEIRRWRADPSTDLDFGQSDPSVSTDPANMEKIQTEILRGAESFQVRTLVLKRTRTISAERDAALELSEAEEFYTTDKLIELEGIPSDVASVLPDAPYDAPTNTAWGWLPRNESRSYPGRGQVEEYHDWVFAAWSTTTYTLVS